VYLGAQFPNHVRGIIRQACKSDRNAMSIAGVFKSTFHAHHDFLFPNAKRLHDQINVGASSQMPKLPKEVPSTELPRLIHSEESQSKCR
jgi:hypothetical protein